MQPDAGIAGIILLPDGAPAAGASVTLCTRSHEVTVQGGKLRCRQGSEDRKLAKTAADGSFRLPAEVDHWVLVVAHDGGYAEATAAEFAKTSSKLQLKALGTHRRRVRAQRQADCGAWECVRRRTVETLTSYCRISDNATTDAAGKFVVERVPPVGLYIYPYFKRGTASYSSFWFGGQTSIAPGRDDADHRAAKPAVR